MYAYEPDRSRYGERSLSFEGSACNVATVSVINIGARVKAVRAQANSTTTKTFEVIYLVWAMACIHHTEGTTIFIPLGSAYGRLAFIILSCLLGSWTGSAYRNFIF
ncbi:hypothetical protein K503DRAFT_110553 [Rhizopogon vinicolor AM-OR11-026]|uniref:Uncharacterized protein n=1 Tax=Rhizopogon vinicolor AM-OR11-026 TaxID=1314800 RepID=A0A1B7N2L0_9AGAM|nr:hypothetical protein K503DRAFT_110553 [Rhizopogon vinicolor AM-OR11-026]